MAELIDRLEELRPKYEIAKASRNDGRFDKKQSEIVAKIRAIVPLPGQLTRDTSLVTMGRIMQILEDGRSDENLILEYESLKASLASAFPEEK